MKNTLFLQSKMEDPYSFYATMRKDHPIYWDESNQIWALYSCESCRLVLHSGKVEIPAVGKHGLNAVAVKILDNLARLSNPPFHQLARAAGMRLMEVVNEQGVGTFLRLQFSKLGMNEIDWVEKIAKKLPAWTVLQAFQFEERETRAILAVLDVLVKFMLPQKMEQDIQKLNEISPQIYDLVKTQLVRQKMMDNAEHVDLYVSNFIGLLIQSYDAGRGLLSNALVQVLKQNQPILEDKEWFKKIVVETTRFDPPIHNTRRVLTDALSIQGQQLKRGQKVLLVLASANRDDGKFNQPHLFDPHRINNHENLTFGTGAHACLAKHFSIALTIETLYFLFNTYAKIELKTSDITFEPLVNARLPKSMVVSLGSLKD